MRGCIMKKLLVCFICLICFPVNAELNYSFNCSTVENNIKRCVNDEVVCYVYDSGWAGFAKSGRGAGISCLPVVKAKEQKPFFIMVPKNEIK